MKILPVNNVQYHSKAKLNVSSSRPMTNTVNMQSVDKLSFGSTAGVSRQLNKAKDLFINDDNFNAIKAVTAGMGLLFPLLISEPYAMTTSFKSKYDQSLNLVKKAFNSLDDKDKENQKVKKEFMDVMFIHKFDKDNPKKHGVDKAVLDIFSEMDNKVYGKYKSSLLKSAIADKGMYYNNIDEMLAKTRMSKEDKVLLKSKNDKNLEDIVASREEVETTCSSSNNSKSIFGKIWEALTYQSDDDYYIPQDPRYTP